MALCVLSANSVPRIFFPRPSSKPVDVARGRLRPDTLALHQLGSRGRSSARRLNAAGLSQIEPDLNEDPVDRWATNSIDEEDFKYGEYDGHHTYHEGEEKGTFWGAIAEDIAAVEPPAGFQGLISWLFLPAVAAGMYFNVPGEYLYIGAAVFTIVFCIIEMGKPDKPHNFEPQIYTMERGARDKLIADYNTMDIWDFNEKYGDLWDFTIARSARNIVEETHSVPDGDLPIDPNVLDRIYIPLLLSSDNFSKTVHRFVEDWLQKSGEQSNVHISWHDFIKTYFLKNGNHF